VAICSTSLSTSVFASTRLRFDSAGVGEVHGVEVVRCREMVALATRHVGQWCSGEAQCLLQKGKAAMVPVIEAARKLTRDLCRASRVWGFEG
jgi:hypothetical protein